MTHFADALTDAIQRTGSALIAGFDPDIATFPEFVLRSSFGDGDGAEKALLSYYRRVIPLLVSQVAAIKINIAFFEQYGVPGLRAFSKISREVRDSGILLVTDAKRGDIGSTAAAYARAFLTPPSTLRGERVESFEADALTVNPFLGFDTLEPFLDACAAHGKGLFILVKTSNPGSSALQGIAERGQTVSETIARWIGDNAARLTGERGYSSLGAVVGATYPFEAAGLRALMPSSYLLIPGMGAQGGTAEDALAGFDPQLGGGIINVSRALFQIDATLSGEEWDARLLENLSSLNGAVQAAIRQRSLT
jgi:orotidine-5'-phosphate decarboxylase